MALNGAVDIRSYFQESSNGKSKSYINGKNYLNRLSVADLLSNSDFGGTGNDMAMQRNRSRLIN